MKKVIALCVCLFSLSGSDFALGDKKEADRTWWCVWDVAKPEKFSICASTLNGCELNLAKLTEKDGEQSTITPMCFPTETAHCFDSGESILCSATKASCKWLMHSFGARGRDVLPVCMEAK